MSDDFSNLMYSFELGKLREETSSVRRHLLNFEKRHPRELVRADLMVGLQDLCAETTHLVAAFDRNLNKSAAAVLGQLNAAAHQMHGTLQQYPEGQALGGQSFNYLNERCKELADRIDELLQEFSVCEREFIPGGSPTKRQSS